GGDHALGLSRYIAPLRGWPASLGMPGRHRSEWVAGLRRNQWPASLGIRNQFHFSVPTEQFQAETQLGVQLGYGASWVILRQTPPRLTRVAFVEPGSPAAAAGLLRGDELLMIDDADAVNANDSDSIATLNRAVMPSAVGQSHAFTVRNAAGSARTVVLTARMITRDPVPTSLVLDNGRLGYLLFNDHAEPAEAALVEAVSGLAAAGISDLALDVRYNGGGLLDIASQLSYMIAGAARTTGQVFETLRFNDQHPVNNPFTGQPLAPIPFHSTTLGFSRASGQPLPRLDLARVFILTGPGSCSATESIINALRGVDVEVIQIGAATCGKPYGFVPADHCGTTYFSIQFQTFNAKGFGDYADGFAPQNSDSPSLARLPGCAVADDFSAPLGDPAEARLSAVLNYRATGGCPVPSRSTNLAPQQRDDGQTERLLQPAWRQARIIRK
ncbi:MAG: S41 family peptidase, partial [Panacagrimonas sp.]